MSPTLNSPSQPAPTLHSAFFYGTLMAPSVLHRVISSSSKNSSSNRTQQLTFTPAILPNHKRRRVAGADYPAVTPCPPSPLTPTSSTSSQNSQSGSSTRKENRTRDESTHVRGTLTHNLTPTDLSKLDLFEGDEYERRNVCVRLLPANVEDGGGVAEPMAYGGMTPVAPRTGVAQDGGQQVEGGEEADRLEQIGREEWVQTQTYIWIAPESELEEDEWDFEQFRKEKLHLWAGVEAVDSGMAEADRFEGGGGGGANGSGGKADGTRGRGVATGEFERAWERRQNDEGGEVLRNAV